MIYTINWRNEMRTKKKISLTINEDTYLAISEASKTYRIAKSQLAQEAFSLWLKKETEELMAKGYEAMSNEDKVMAEQAFDAQKEMLE
jgi:hypothetical protein